MLVRNIEYPTTLDKIEDLENDNIDVFVTLEDGFKYVTVVSTIKNMENFVKKEGFLEPGTPLIIVDFLEENLIRRAIEFHAQDNAYWLKMDWLYVWFETEQLNEKIKQNE
ncbi:hypothetical protein IW492_11375 [Enterococcus sp. BWB1-3]|uniref:hypothetical protein n=1 Tax=Enterococcus sp. BWB1-3 TaxID=2787713 RepID=UPI001920648A|nr:hypothetical protein [Enterococcus sp. BWB1-3]MBL1229832.1 hypothetical protein [Enterococcus sp. BWB1-3]